MGLRKRSSGRAAIMSVGGLQIVGEIDNHDTFTIALDGPTPKLVYKHAIAVVRPADGVKSDRVGPTHGRRNEPVIEVKRRKKLYRE